jgi:uncharacterized protein YkwD
MTNFAIRTLLTLCLTVGPVVAAAQDAFDGAAEQALLDRINEIRQQAGSGALTRDARLDAAARQHSAEMAAVGQLMHVSPHTGTPIDRVHAAGLETDEVAENVAMHADATSAQQALEASDAHLANMLNPRFTAHGGGIDIAAGNDIVATVCGPLGADASGLPGEPLLEPA